MPTHRAAICLCRLALGGAAVAAIRASPIHKLAPIPAGEAATWRASYRVAAFDRISLQAFLLLPAKCAVEPGAAQILILFSACFWHALQKSSCSAR